MEYAKRILDKVGVGGERLEMFNMSSAEGKKWAEICTEVTARIKELGPNPVRRKSVEATSTQDSGLSTQDTPALSPESSVLSGQS